MFSLLALAVTAAASVPASVIYCLDRSLQVSPDLKPTVFVLKVITDGSISVESSRGSTICNFEKHSSLTVFNNIYRPYGRLRLRNGHVAATYYRNIVGNGGSIEIFRKETRKASVLRSLWERLSQNGQPDDSSTHERIYLSSKLAGNSFDIFIDENNKYSWSGSRLTTDVHRRSSAATSEAPQVAIEIYRKNPEEFIVQVYKDAIDVSLSIYVAVFLVSSRAISQT